MNRRFESCRQRDDRTAKHILPEANGELNQGDGTGSGRGATPLHRGGARAEANVGGGPGANYEARGLSRIPAGVRASVVFKSGEYDARRLRSQREIIRDVMVSAADCETWLTLGELRALTRYGEASISAQLRHLRKTENGGYEVIKRHREGATPERPGTDGRGECVWEYRITRGICVAGMSGDPAGEMACR